MFIEFFELGLTTSSNSFGICSMVSSSANPFSFRWVPFMPTHSRHIQILGLFLQSQRQWRYSRDAAVFMAISASPSHLFPVLPSSMAELSYQYGFAPARISRRVVVRIWSTVRSRALKVVVRFTLHQKHFQYFNLSLTLISLPTANREGLHLI